MRTRAAVALAAVALAAGACSSGGSKAAAPSLAPRQTGPRSTGTKPAKKQPSPVVVTVDDWKVAVNGICGETLRSVGDFASNPSAAKGATAPEAVALYVDGVRAAATSGIEKLKTVPKPSDGVPAGDLMIASYEQMLTDLSKISEGLRTAGSAGVVERERASAQLAIDANTGDGYARAAGLDACAMPVPAKPGASPDADSKAQEVVRDVDTAEKRQLDETGTYTGEGWRLLDKGDTYAVVPTLDALDGHDRIAYVTVSADKKVAFVAAKSETGTCFWLRDDSTALTTTYAAGSCTAVPADKDFKAVW